VTLCRETVLFKIKYSQSLISPRLLYLLELPIGARIGSLSELGSQSNAPFCEFFFFSFYAPQSELKLIGAEIYPR
jgi:hypothetical protein